MKVKTKKNIFTGLLIVFAILISCGLWILCSNPISVLAASNTDINDISMIEYTNHTLTNSVSGCSSYSEQPNRNSGIRIYGSSNTGVLKYNSPVKVDNNSVYLDFRNAVALYIPKAPEGSWGSTTYYDKTYRFEILSGSSVKWYATYTGSTYSQVTGKDENGNDVSKTFYRKVVNVNGRSTTTSSDQSTLRHFSPRDFGNNTIYLNDGTYTVRITRSYHWQYYKSWISIPKYESTSTQTGTLIVDTISPTLTMRGNSSGSSISDGKYVNESVTFSAYDSNHYRLYYKTPESSSYTYTTNKTYTTGSTNGWYYAYAEDTHGHRSPTYSVYYDNVLPVGTLKSNGSTISSGTTVSKSFAYTVTDSGSGIKSVYYQTPVNSSYVAYTPGTIIPASAGDGWYYFYATDNSGNRSSIVSVCLDTTKPTLTLKGYSSGNAVQSGANVKERVTVTASDTHFSRLYYKAPGSSSFTATTSKTYTSGTTNGTYEVYAVDTVGNKSETLSFFYDNTAPTGKVYSNGSAVSSGAYISKNFSYSAIDDGSGIATLYCKTPVSGTYLPYAAGTVITSNSGDGWYYFYAVDKVGNQSVTTSVYLETQAPLVEIYRNDELAYSKTITSAGTFDTDIYLNPNDKLRISCDTSSGKVTSNYTLDTNITIDSAYSDSNYTITLTSATGIASNFTYHIVRSKPTITIDGMTYSSGSTLHFNSDKNIRFNDDSVITNSGNTGATVSSEGNVNLNEHITYASGNSKTLTTASGTETKYILTLNDRAGNVSRFTVFIDKLAPAGVWKTNGATLPNGGYTNKPLSFNITEAGVTATYSHNGGEYAAYTSGKTLTADGTYNVVITDLADNKSTFTAHIDTVAPIGQIYADNKSVQSGTITNKAVFFSWDGDITATVNGAPYTKNSVLMDDAQYNFVLTDFAGNKTKYTVTIDTVAPTYNAEKLTNSQQLISKWYIANIGGSDYSFATYDEALAFACNKEFGKSVTVLVLDDVANFNQHHLIADGGEVRVGEYWLYKSKANPDSLLYYFDRTVLDEVVAHYAKENISTVNYYSLDEDNVYGEPAGSMTDNVFTAPDGATAPVLNGFIFDRADGSELYAELVGGNGASVKIEYGIAFDKQISVGGLYRLVERDEAGNVTVFYGFMDVLAPELKATATIIGNSEPTELVIAKQNLTGGAAFYYESFSVNEIMDADKWSVLTVENGGKKSCYTYGDELPCLNVGGEYLFTVYDRLGNGFSFTVYIIGNPATIDFKNNSDDTEFRLSITLEQKFDTLVSLEIRKDGKLLDGVSTDTLSYTFDRAGTYTVTLRDNFGRIISKEYTFNKAKPNGEFAGVDNGGKTKHDVAFTYDSEKFYAVVTKDGQAFKTDRSGKITFKASDANSGIYAIRLIRLTDEENYSDYGFTMNTLASEFDLTVSDGSTTNKNVTVSWTAEDIMSVTYSLNSGEPVEVKNGTVLSAEGVYIVTATNDLGTQSVKTFTIDKTVDYHIEVGAEPARNVEVTNENVVVFNGEDLSVSVMKNGEPYAYAFGDVLSEEGFYTFRLSDDFGNSATFSVTIDKSVSYSANIGNGLIASENVQLVNGEKLTVTVTKDNQVIDYEFGQPLEAEGAYKVLMKDAYGNEKTLEFRIVKGVKATLDYTLGENVSVLKIERDGEEILFEDNRLNFTESGVYTVTAEAEGKTYSFVLELDRTAPTLKLIGVKDGGVSGKSVTLDNLSEQATVEVFKDGELIKYELGSELKEYGEYRVVVTDEAGNSNEYNFTLKYKMDGGIIALIVISVFAAVGGGVFLFIKKRKRA